MALQCTVVSLVPFVIDEFKPGLVPPRFHIEPSDMKTPQILHVKTANHFVYLDQDRGTLPVRNPPDIIAKSIVEDYCSSQLGVDEDSRPALFWLEEDLTLEQVVETQKPLIIKHLLAQKSWMLNICKIADNDWERYHQHNVISSFQMRCAEIIGWKPTQHEWMSVSSTMKTQSCPSCHAAVHESITVCPQCHCVLDKEKYATFEYAKR